MKRRVLCLLIAFVIVFISSSKISVAQTDTQLEIVVPEVEPPTSYEEVIQRITAWEEKIPTGTPWDNHSPYGDTGYLGDSYLWKGIAIDGYGCSAFAFLLSDVAFGDLPAIKIDKADIHFEDIRVGDILRLNDDKHSAIVIQTTPSSIITAEGNVGGKVKWHRVYSKNQIMEKLTYMYTRYPDATGSNVTDSDVTDSDATDSDYIYAYKQKKENTFIYLYDSNDTIVDEVAIINGKLIYQAQPIDKFKSIRWVDFNQVGHVIITLKNGNYYVMDNNLNIKKLGKNAKSRQKKNGLITHIKTKNGKKKNVSKK